MIIWIDAQFSPSLAKWIADTFGIPAQSFRELGLREAKDYPIFQAAREADAIVLTKDADFDSHNDTLCGPETSRSRRAHCRNHGGNNALSTLKACNITAQGDNPGARVVTLGPGLHPPTRKTHHARDLSQTWCALVFAPVRSHGPARFVSAYFP